MSHAPRIHDKGRIRTLVRDRPEKKNALSNELAWGIVTAVEEAARNDSVWAFAITGRGDAFCSGLDLGGPRPRCLAAFGAGAAPRRHHWVFHGQWAPRGLASPRGTPRGPVVSRQPPRAPQVLGDRLPRRALHGLTATPPPSNREESDDP